MYSIFYLLNSSIKNSCYLCTLNKLRIALVRTFQHPVLMLRILKVVILFKYSKIDIMRDFKKLNYPAYSNTFKFSDRVEAFIFHNIYIINNLGSKLVKYSNDGIKLWSSSDVELLEIYLSRTELHFNHEGILSLTLRFDGQPVFFISFLICNGRTLNLSGPIFFLSRIQGIPKNYASIRLVNKLLNNLNLSNTLLSAAEGVALALNIKKIISVNAFNQISYNSDGSKGNFRSTYDEFLIKNAAFLERDGYFSLPVPLPTKELKSVKAHRSRHKRHLAIRREVSEAARAAIEYEMSKRSN